MCMEFEMNNTKNFEKKSFFINMVFNTSTADELAKKSYFSGIFFLFIGLFLGYIIVSNFSSTLNSMDNEKIRSLIYFAFLGASSVIYSVTLLRNARKAQTLNREEYFANEVKVKKKKLIMFLAISSFLVISFLVLIFVLRT